VRPVRVRLAGRRAGYHLPTCALPSTLSPLEKPREWLTPCILDLKGERFLGYRIAVHRAQLRIEHHNAD
jgi:hypothetical protein